MTANHITLLRSGFSAAVQAAQAKYALPPYLPTPPSGRTIVIGMGKAGAAMAQAVENAWQGDKSQLSGVVVVPYGSTLPTQRIRLIEAAHPVPDHNSVQASQQIHQAVHALSADDLVICLISGGGSSLLSLPATGLTLEAKQQLSQQLLHSGASIDEINIVRKHLSAIKGGRLAAACYPARVVNLIISDVPGDDPSHIASGPTVADPSSAQAALQILQHYAIALSPTIQHGLQSCAWESIKADDPRLARVQTHVIATPHTALQAAATLYQEQGYTPLVLGDTIEGEAKEVAKVMAAIVKYCQKHGQPAAAPAVLLSGGETTVQVKGNGCGGRNVEFLLALLIALKDQFPYAALAADTDGVDGAAPVAGAFITDQSWNKALALGLDPMDYLQRQDAHQFFQRLDQQLITGPTQTNVNDFRAILLPA